MPGIKYGNCAAPEHDPTGTESGFSLLEMLIIMGMMALASLCAANLVTYQMKAESSLNSSVSFTGMVQQIQDLLQNPAICANLLPTTQVINAGMIIPLAQVPMTLLSHEDPVAIAGNRYPGFSINSNLGKTKGISVGNIAITSDPYTFTANLNLTGTKTTSRPGESAVGGSLLAGSIPLTLRTNASNQFTGCSGQNQSIWSKSTVASPIIRYGEPPNSYLTLSPTFPVTPQSVVIWVTVQVQCWSTGNVFGSLYRNGSLIGTYSSAVSGHTFLFTWTFTFIDLSASVGSNTYLFTLSDNTSGGAYSAQQGNMIIQMVP